MFIDDPLHDSEGRNPIKRECVKTYWAKIYLSGPLPVIEHTCREFCLKGLCVTVEPTRFIYTGGEETGAIVGLVNYPRFPVENQHLIDTANKLAMKLLEATFQHSVMVVTPEYTFWHTKREQ